MQQHVPNAEKAVLSRSMVNAEPFGALALRSLPWTPANYITYSFGEATSIGSIDSLRPKQAFSKWSPGQLEFPSGPSSVTLAVPFGGLSYSGGSLWRP